MSIEVRPLADADEARWDAYVRAHPLGTFFHLAGWRRVVAGALGHRHHYLQVFRDGELSGVLPLGQVRSRLFGNALISVPFCVYGGVLADDADSAAGLVAEATRLGETLGVDYVELRNREPRKGQIPDEDGLYVWFSRGIDEDPEANLKAIPRKQRAMVRKGIQAGLESVVNDDVDGFFDLYSLSVRNLGTPVLPRRWFHAVREEFGDDVEVLSVMHEGTAVSSVMSYYFRDQVLPYYGGGGDAARGLKANDFMYYALMNHAATRGAREFDYGRSKKGSGSYSFKKNWGFEPRDLAYDVHLVRATEPPALNPNNPKYQLAIKTWKRLPVPVTRVLGPMIARALG